MFAAAVSYLLEDVDPMTLPIGPKGTVKVSEGLYALPSGRDAAMLDIVKACEGKRYIIVGESHAHPKHQEYQAAVIRALAQAGRPVAVGFEMFTRPNQINLAPWSLGQWDEAKFRKEANWDKEWGYSYDSYRPIFTAVRDWRLPMVALNMPRDWVRAVGKTGELPAEAKGTVPPLDTTNTDHRSVWNAMIGTSHPMPAATMDKMYAAQVLWDTGMADTAVKYMAGRGKDAIIVILAGSGHAMYKQAINYRIKKQTGEDCVTVVMTESKDPVTVSKGLGDFVLVTTP